MSFSLRRRLLTLLAGGFTVTIALGAALIYKATLHEADEIFDYHMEEVADTLAAAGLPLLAVTPSPPQPGADRIEEKLDVVARIEAPDGRLLHAIGSWPFAAATAPGFSDVDGAHRPYRVFVRATPERTVRVAQDTAARRELARNLALEAIAPILILAPLLLGGVWWLVRRSLAPLDRTRSQIAERVASDLTALPSRGLPDEVVPLVDEINLLFARLRQSFDAQAAFVADAAHELRSPLAALRVQAQGVQKATDAETREVAVRRLLSGLDRATRLVEQMLTLARHDAPATARGAAQPVALRALAGEVVASLAEVAAQKGLDLGLTDGLEVLAPGHPEALRTLLQNLVDNAIKYTPAGGTIDVSVGADGGRAWLAVEDSGPGIAPPERTRVFDRFFRVAGHEAGGSGLGLSIVRAVADAHGATVELGASPGLRGLQARVTFPAP